MAVARGWRRGHQLGYTMGLGTQGRMMGRFCRGMEAMAPRKCEWAEATGLDLNNGQLCVFWILPRLSKKQAQRIYGERR